LGCGCFDGIEGYFEVEMKKGEEKIFEDEGLFISINLALIDLNPIRKYELKLCVFKEL